MYQQLRTLDRFSTLLSVRGDMSSIRSIPAHCAMYYALSKESLARLSVSPGAIN